jgi:hypothetical protein
MRYIDGGYRLTEGRRARIGGSLDKEAVIKKHFPSREAQAVYHHA